MRLFARAKSYTPLFAHLLTLLLFAQTGCIRDYNDFLGVKDADRSHVADAGLTDQHKDEVGVHVVLPDIQPTGLDVLDLVATAEVDVTRASDVDIGAIVDEDTQDLVDLPVSKCGDSVCSGQETCANCPDDCGDCCGNSACDNGETCDLCPADCVCPPGLECVDGACQACIPEELDVCSTLQGECEIGTWECQADGSWGDCSGVLPTDEICDGKDNDCDGETDEGDPEGGEACGSDTGECVAGKLTCINDSLVCHNEVPPTDEVCDNKDNDCDGEIDNDLAADKYEENGSCDLASDLGELEEGAETLAVMGTLYKDGAADTDWYKVHFNEASDIIPPCGMSVEDMCYFLTVVLEPSAGVNQELCVKLEDCGEPQTGDCVGAGNAIQIQWEGVFGLADDLDLFLWVHCGQSCAPYIINITPGGVCPEDGKCPGDA